VFSAAASGLSLAAASAAFHVVRARMPWLWPDDTARTLLWLLAATVCVLLWSALSQTLVITAVKLSDPTTNAGRQLLTREPLLNDVCEMSAGLVLATAVARTGWPVLIPALPLVIMLQRSCRHAQLQSEARIDAKTGLLNAAAWRTEATVRLAHAERTRAPVALAIADLDHFKAVNDTPRPPDR
jgi:predicted signal transduction protein with EAL and GGDEF domain